MAKVLTRRRLIVGIVALVIVGAIGGSVAMRLAKKDEGKGPAAVTLEFAPSDLTLQDLRDEGVWPSRCLSRQVDRTLPSLVFRRIND